jgi:hypothetical protein
MGNTLGHWMGKNILEIDFQNKKTKAKIDKQDYIKLNSFFIAKETITTGKRVKGNLQNGIKYLNPMHL